jgi:ubiquinone/menaquinone biosynthesis C-methylase UbiE
MDLKLSEWEESYKRGENFIFYPKEEVVKFINRYVVKRKNIDEFIPILTKQPPIKGLDLGCGIGRNTILLEEFGILAYGIDISKKAIETAKKLAVKLGFYELTNRLSTYDGTNIPFPNNFFDIVIAESVLDSMFFNIAKKLIKEMDRVTSYYAFISLISGDCDKYYPEFSQDIVVEEQHEKGTIQSYYNYTKVLELINDTNFKIKEIRKITEEGINFKYKNARYFIVLEK